MGQTGSVEQRSAIRAITSIRPGDGDKQQILDALRAFSAAFPLQPAETTATEVEDPGVNAVGVDVKERRLFDAVHALLQQQAERTERGSNEELMELLLLSFKRIIMWREMYRLCAKCSMKPFLSCLYLSPKLVQTALGTISCMITAPPGPDAGEKSERWEIANRRNFGDAGGFEVLRSLLVQYSADSNPTADKDTILITVIELFHLTLVSRRFTTDFLTCSQAVGALMNARISLLELCHDANTAIQDYAIDLVKELFSITDLDQVHELQESAREYGALLFALATALSKSQKSSESNSTPTNSAGVLQEKCIDLVEIFCAGNTRSKKAMFRIFPVELFIPAENRADLIARHTASSSLVRAPTRTNRSLPHFSFDFESMSTLETKRNRVMSVANNAKNIGSGAFDKWLSDARAQGEHWRNIIESVLVDHERPELVWRDSMRSELRAALHAEIDHLEKTRRQHETSSGTVVRWDHEMFYVNYMSFEDELIVNGYFIEYLIPKLNNLADSFEVTDPMVLAWHLSDRLAVETNPRWRILCARCLRLVLRRYAMIFHGQLPIQNLLGALSSHAHESPAFLREAFQLLNTAIVTTRNAPSDNFNRLSTTLVRAVVDVLADPVFLANLSGNRQNDGGMDDSGHSSDASDEEDDSADSDDGQIFVRNPNDAVVRAGVTLLLSITTRSKFTLLLVRSKRIFLCRLLALETLDHVTVTRILTLLKKVAVLDGSRTSSFTLPAKRGSVSSSSMTAMKTPIDGNWKSLALVYVVFASCDPKGMGMCAAAADFLKENCLARVGSSGTTEFSKLLGEGLGFGGRGMGKLLESAPAKTFTEVFNAHEKRAADVNWGRRQRLRLYRYLRNKYISSTGDQYQGNQSESVSIGPDHFGNGSSDGEFYQDEDDIFVGNIFLRSYIEGDGEFLNEWTPDMYANLINALFTRLSDLGRAKGISSDVASSNSAGPATLRGFYAEPWEVQVLILKALVRLIPSRCSSIEIRREYYEALLTPMKRTLLGEEDQIRGILALELILAILAGPVAPEESRGVNVSSCIAFLRDKGLKVLGEALERMLNPSFQELLKFSHHGIHNMACVLLYRITDVVTSLTGHASGVSALQKNPTVVTALLELSSRHTIMTYSEDAATVCLSCVAGLCHSDALRSLVVGAGGLLFFLETSAFCPAEEAISSDVSTRPEDDENDESEASHKPSRYIGAVRSAALALRSCLDDKGDEKARLPLLVLKQLLTPSFVRILRASPDRFILLLQSNEDIDTATLIWKASMRERLRECLETELAKVKTAARSKIWPRWNPEHFVAADSFRYQYPELADELILQDVYLNNFLATKGEPDLEDIDMSALSEALLISIQSNENVLRILEERGASDPSKEAAVRTMRQALNKLVSTHPQHNLEVDPSLQDQTPPATPEAAAGDAAMRLPGQMELGSASFSSAASSVTSTSTLVLSTITSQYPEAPSPLYGRDSSVDLEDLTV